MKNQIDKNYRAFKKQLPNIIGEHRGKYALLHDTKIIGYLDKVIDAYSIGFKLYGEGNFSIQEVTDEPNFV